MGGLWLLCPQYCICLKFFSGWNVVFWEWSWEWLCRASTRRAVDGDLPSVWDWLEFWFCWNSPAALTCLLWKIVTMTHHDTSSLLQSSTGTCAMWTKAFTPPKCWRSWGPSQVSRCNPCEGSPMLPVASGSSWRMVSHCWGAEETPETCCRWTEKYGKISARSEIVVWISVWISECPRCELLVAKFHLQFPLFHPCNGWSFAIKHEDFH